MAYTLKDLAVTGQVVMQEALRQSLTNLKTYIDQQDAAGSSAAQDAIDAVNERLDTLIGGEEGDVDKVINTFNEIKDFLAQIDDDGDTLKQILDAINTAISNEVSRASAAEQANASAISAEATRAQNAESALSGRVTTLENIAVMTSTQATGIFNEVFNPVVEEEEPQGE